MRAQATSSCDLAKTVGATVSGMAASGSLRQGVVSEVCSDSAASHSTSCAQNLTQPATIVLALCAHTLHSAGNINFSMLPTARLLQLIWSLHRWSMTALSERAHQLSVLTHSTTCA